VRVGAPRRRWALWVSAATLAYVGVLLAVVYLSQAQLRAAAETRVLAESRQLASVLGDALANQRAFVRHVAESHEIDTFLVNRALGMSMRYGLAGSLFDIEAMFRRRMLESGTLGAPSVRRLLYVGEDGQVLVDTSSNAPAVAWDAAAPEGTATRLDVEHGRIVSSATVTFRGKPAGTVVSLVDAGALTRFLVAPAGDGEAVKLLVTDTRGVIGQTLPRALPASANAQALAGLAPDVLVPIPDGTGRGAPACCEFAIRTAVPGGPASLVTLLPASSLYGMLASRVLLVAIGAMPLALAAGAFSLYRMRRRAERLQAKFAASDRSREELQGRNDALTVEIGRRAALERELRDSEARYRTYIEHAPEGIFVADADGRFVDMNESACAMVGYSRDELLARTITDLSPPGEAPAHRAIHRSARADTAQETEITLRRKDGSDLVASLRTVLLPGARVMGFCVDVTERKRAEDQIRQLAYYDPLTGLPNRRLFQDRLRQAMARSGRDHGYVALLMLDLDHFKDLNDTQGHDVGDRLLAEVAARLGATVRRQDTVSRLGGDEYVVIAEELGRDEETAMVHAETIAATIHGVLSEPYPLVAGKPAHHSTPSIGVTLFRGAQTPIDVLLKQADVALYQAKSAGRNSIRFFNPQMQAAIDARAAMEEALRQGLECGQLALHFQPQVDRHARVTGAEALLRWFPPGGEPVSPARFIPLAEESGLIVPIGRWVIGQACAQLARWRDDPASRHLVLSVNVSARQFLQPEFADEVRHRVSAAGVDPSRLMLELTESVVLDRVDEVVDKMQQLKAFGVGFSLDDFGTGYSSLSYLKRLPLDQVKIDRSFIRDVTHDANDAAIVLAVLAMSRSLGLSVVAEGVETEAQRAFLARHDCEGYQGFLFGRPAPIESWRPPDPPAPPAAAGSEAIAPGAVPSG